MAKILLVANWKSHPDSLEKANEFLADLSKKHSLYKKISLYIAPPAVYLETVSKKIKKFGSLAIQDVPLMADGTHTGELSMHMLKDFGVRLGIIGHSDRRILGETNEVVNHKIKNALKAGIIPLLCVGEREKDIDGEHYEFIREQIVASLYKINKKEDVAKIMIAYEPVWAIGKKAQDAMSPEDIGQTLIYIRKVLNDMYGRELAHGVPILYGGAVEAENILEILKVGVSGFLVGHASLDMRNFNKMALELNS